MEDERTKARKECWHLVISRKHWPANTGQDCIVRQSLGPSKSLSGRTQPQSPRKWIGSSTSWRSVRDRKGRNSEAKLQNKNHSQNHIFAGLIFHAAQSASGLLSSPI